MHTQAAIKINVRLMSCTWIIVCKYDIHHTSHVWHTLVSGYTPVY